jgi:glycosyltransferase involved in cell wall biosynthesis
MRFVMDARYAGPQASGIGSYVRAIGARLPELARQAHFHFWVPPAALPLSHAPNASHATVRFRPTGISTLLFPSLLDTLRATDVFHGPANILGFGLPCPSVVTVHDVMWIEHLDWCQPRPWLRPISGPYFATGIRRALRHADCLLTVSKASADAIVRLEPSAHQRVFVTPNACEPHFRPAASQDAARRAAAECLGSDAPFFLVVGQNQPSKAHAAAVRAFAAANVGQHRLVLVQRLDPGRGLESLARELGVEDRVTFVSSVPLDSLISLYQAATALVHPSLAEGFGLPVLEAMASGCPVIASDIAPLREILGSAGLYTAPASVAELTRQLEAASHGGAWLEEARAQGLERARSFSWDRTAALTLEVYELALERQHSESRAAVYENAASARSGNVRL